MKLHSKTKETLYQFVLRVLKNVEVYALPHEIFFEGGTTTVNVGDKLEDVLKSLKLSISIARLAAIS
jgi:hypothetical protein